MTAFYIFAIFHLLYLILLFSVLRSILSKNIIALWDEKLADALAVFFSTDNTAIDMSENGQQAQSSWLNKHFSSCTDGWFSESIFMSVCKNKPRNCVHKQEGNA